MRHILAASQSERNALFRASPSDRSSQIQLLAQQRRVLIVQPTRHQRPHLSLRRFAHQHLDMLNIVFAELIEGNYVLYQGDLSTNCVGKAQKPAARGSIGRLYGLDLENK